ncbi:hypothetical protein [Aquipseudomonas alcaligenes]|uniref:Uncharacterized protein n=1 Tax=Aquipseudomonas alcaligenes (strain ATCC 14909 / DSM 50342 / CCUG 1425 / JCM 20561 / NBRC 14159 / NCIMB 9945 / NCTC 10367 / 1577) TaxID=1215092 RepID=U2ZRF3_AQUA1|nr:hypothetical protein [Pseudomonas alcaligenes]GAD64020.1 hypothetical protein PA6_032_00340 [Pseudomonas alcaligenes NBRC 14159]SUD20300.1 Uncharacterised protein [Pseudomonas alcaligenes]
MNAFIENHKYLAATILFAALACGGVSSAQAEDVAKGVLIVRGDAHGFTPNQGDNYKNEERNINDRLEGVSALCASSGSQTAAALVLTDTTRNWAGYMSSNTTTIINQGGKVVKDPLPGNPNHCLINGLKLGQIKGIWN